MIFKESNKQCHSCRFHFYVYHSIRSWEEESQKRDDSELTEEQRRVVTYKFKGKELLKVEACAGKNATVFMIAQAVKSFSWCRFWKDPYSCQVCSE